MFVQVRRDDKIAVITAHRGAMSVDASGARWLVLENGRALEGVPGQVSYDVMEFAKGKIRIDAPKQATVSAGTRALPSLELLKSNNPEHQAELAWRISLPICGLILSLLAVPLAFYNVRGGRAFNMIFAVMLAFFYYNCINIAQAWIAIGKLPVAESVWVIIDEAAQWPRVQDADVVVWRVENPAAAQALATVLAQGVSMPLVVYAAPDLLTQYGAAWRAAGAHALVAAEEIAQV